MELLPQYEGLEVVQKTYRAFGNEYHRYQVWQENADGGTEYICDNCAECRKGKKCKGLPSVTSVSGQYGGGGLYPAGYKHALDAVFGAWTTKDKISLDGTGFLDDGLPSDGLEVVRQEVEYIPTPGFVAREFGSKVHAALESALRGDDQAVVPVECADAVKAVTDWLQKGGADGPYIVEDVEVNVFHPELRIGGQIDCVARCGNQVILIDWKSGRDIYPNHAMQIAAYQMCYEAMTGEAVSEAWIVKSGKHGFDAKQVKDLAPAQRAFIAMQEAKKNVESIEWAEGGA